MLPNIGILNLFRRFFKNFYMKREYNQYDFFSNFDIVLIELIFINKIISIYKYISIGKIIINLF